MNTKRHSDPDVRAYHVDDAAKAYGLSRTTLYKLMAEGRLQSVQVGRRRLILRDLLEFLFWGLGEMSPSFKDDANQRPRPRLDPPLQVPEWRIETLAEAEQRNDKRIDQLLANGAQGIGRAIARCDATDGKGCGQPACAICSRIYRDAVIPRLSGLAASLGPGCMVSTLYLEHHPPGQLEQANPRRIKNSLRKLLDRSGLNGAVLAGGNRGGLAGQTPEVAGSCAPSHARS